MKEGAAIDMISALSIEVSMMCVVYREKLGAKLAELPPGDDKDEIIKRTWKDVYAVEDLALVRLAKLASGIPN
jgi:hypothetical protein